MYKIELRDGYLLQKLQGSLTANEVKAFIEEAVKIVRKPGNKMCILNDYRGAYLNEPEVKDLMRDWVKGNEPYIEKAAVLGIEGIKKLFFQMITAGRKHIKTFDSEEEAIKWLKS